MIEKSSWRQGQEDWLPPLVPDMHLDPTRTALMVIDMQYADAHRDYGIGKLFAQLRSPRAVDYYFARVERVVVPNTVKLLRFCREHKLRIVFVCVGALAADYSDIGVYRQKHERRTYEVTKARIFYHQDEFEYSLLHELEHGRDEPILHKSSSGLFNSSGADVVLRSMGIDSLVITGVVTNGCVETTARDAADRSYKCVLVEDACAAFDEQAHNATLRSFACISGNVWTTDDVVRRLSERLRRD